jgi:hypothetical protein
MKAKRFTPSSRAALPDESRSRRYYLNPIMT